MQLRFLLAASAASLTMAAAIATPAYAQETASAVRGTVMADGQPVGGATVTIIHTPSGTTASTTTDAGGNFSSNGLRVGGPFAVTVEAEGFEAATVNDLFLQAGTPARLPIMMQAAQQIVVTASSITSIAALSDGPTTSLNAAKIASSASINRDVRDLARRDPLVTMDLTNSRTIEIAGNNGRFNRFSVDGMQMSDDFGLNNGGLPTGRGPVPFDAIEQFTVKVAPYDIAEGDLQGGAINVVLKSGGNNFHGGGFYSYTDDSLTGSKSKDRIVNLDFDSKQFGGWLSGPLVKDKLFFMLAYERTKEGRPLEAGFGDGFANQVPGLTQTVIDQVSSIAQSRFGYDTQGLISTTQEEDEKIVGKLDWNISDDHRAALTYIRNVGTNQFQQNTFLTAPFALGFLSNGYELREEVNSGTLEINSTWSDSFSTTVRGSYRDYNRAQTPFGGNAFPQMEVCTDATARGSATGCDGTRLFFGPDVSRHSNALNTENLSFDVSGRYDTGDLTLRLNAGYTRVNVYNLFLQRSLGDFYFDSLADFTAGNAARLRYGNAVPSNDPNDAAARFNTTNWTFGTQVDWQITPTFDVMLGLRYDLFDNNVLPPLNANFVSRYGFSNRETFKGRGAFQPRFAANWEATDRLVFRAGAGVFAGGTPDVYLSNVFSNTGQLTNAVDITRANCAASGTCGALNGLTTGAIPTTVQDFLARNTASLAAAPTDNIDPNLKIAQKLKTTFQADYKADLGPLGDNWMFGAQFLYDNTLQGYLWRDLRSVAIGTLPDGRTRYGPIGGIATTNRDLQLTNTSDGRSLFGTFRVEKSWDFGLGMSASYTRADVKDRSSSTSSTSGSNYGNNAFFDPNLPAYGRSIYEFRNQWKFGVDYSHAFFGDAKTTFSLFGELRSGRPYSLTMLDNTNGRGAVYGTVGNLGNVLLYVPTGPSDPLVQFDNAASAATFETLVGQLGLEKYRGKVVPKNSQTSPSFFKVDLHFGQEIPVPMISAGKIELFADIENVLNMIDKDWGALSQVEFAYNAAVVRVTCATTSGPNCTKYQYGTVQAPNEVLQTRQSLYGIRIGAKVKF